jgi:hypothetical protein
VVVVVVVAVIPPAKVVMVVVAVVPLLLQAVPMTAVPAACVVGGLAESAGLWMTTTGLWGGQAGERCPI